MKSCFLSGIVTEGGIKNWGCFCIEILVHESWGLSISTPKKCFMFKKDCVAGKIAF